MTTEHRENRSLPIRTAVEPASLLPLSAHMSYGQMRMALYNVAPDLQGRILVVVATPEV